MILELHLAIVPFNSRKDAVVTGGTKALPLLYDSQKVLVRAGKFQDSFHVTTCHIDNGGERVGWEIGQLWLLLGHDFI